MSHFLFRLWPQNFKYRNWTLDSEVAMTYCTYSAVATLASLCLPINIYGLKGGPWPDANYNKLYSFSERDKTNLKIPLVQVQRCLLISKGISLSTCQPAFFLNTCLELSIKFLQGLFC